VARSFSGDKPQLVPLLRAALHHRGFALIDVLSPCVTFNDHEGSTRSYAYTREHYEEAVHADFVPPAQQIAVDYAPGETQAVTMHDGSRILLRKIDARYDPSDPAAALQALQTHQKRDEYLTGLLYLGADQPELHELSATPDQPLNQIPYERLNPGPQALAKTLARFR
jgi:2-oxoglutarate ferredoxin oxidoreductase subunit beta